MGILRAIRRNRIHRKVLRATDEQAISILCNYLQKDPHWQDCRILLAKLYAKRLGFDAVITVMKEHTGLFPEDTRALFILASTLRLLGHHEQAITLLESLRKLAPDFPGLQTVFAAALMETEPSRALQLIDEVLSYEPNDAENHHYRGRILANLERWSEAKKEFRIASELEPGKTTYLMVLALHCCEFGDYEDARTHLQHALTLDPNNAFICVNWARFQADFGNKDEAIALCCEGIERFMGDRVAARDFAEILVNICVSDKEPKPAALTRGPASDDVPSILDQRILPLLRTYLDRDPDWLDGRIDVARVQEHYGRREEAAEILGVALERVPENGGLRQVYADYLLDLGRTDEAFDIILPATKSGSHDAGALCVLAKCYARMQDFEQMQKVCERVEALDPEAYDALLEELD